MRATQRDPSEAVRIDKGASTPRDGIPARGSEPENIRKPVDSISTHERELSDRMPGRVRAPTDLHR